MAVIKAGLYKFNDEIVFPSSDAYININFTTPDLSYVCNSIRFNTDLNIVAYYFGEQSSSIYYNGWITGRDRTFKVLYNTTVDDDSYNIFKENINVFIPIGTYEFNYSSTPPSTGSSISTATLKVRIPDFELVENGQRKILNTDSFEYTLYTNFSLYGVVGRAIGFAYNQQNLNHKK